MEVSEKLRTPAVLTQGKFPKYQLESSCAPEPIRTVSVCYILRVVVELSLPPTTVL
jgi:hypothetical protein